jgi:2-(1,2-epoxy-1,2-dihydrophenyl)acetyl-CoA isomerase
MTILTHFQDGVLTLLLNRPEKFNSFNREMALRLQAELDRAAEDETVRAIVLTGEGKAFCAGQDLAEVMDPEGPELEKIVSEHYNPIIEKIRHVHKPVIAAVNGVAAGAGANLALCCDLVVAAESASFIQAFSKIGLIPDSAGTFFLPRLIGFQKASALMMTADKVGAAEAERLGMIYQVYTDDTFKDQVFLLAAKMASMPTKGLWLTKKALNKSLTNSLTEQLSLEHELQEKAGQTEDYHEGVTAFLEKRQPVFKGQ